MTAGLVLLAFCLPVSIAGVNAALAATTLLLILRRHDKNLWRALHSSVLYALAAYCAAGLLSAALGVDPAVSFPVWRKDLHKLWVAALMLLAADEEGSMPPAVAAALFAGFGVAAAWGVLQTLGTPSADWSVRWVRAHGFVHPVSFGAQLVIALVGCASFLARTPRGLEGWRRPVGALCALLAAAMVFNQTRAAALALAAGAGALWYAERKALKWSLAAGALVVALFACWEVMPTGGRSMTRVLAPAAGVEAAASNPHQARFVLWDAAWRMFRDRPVTGVGPGGYRGAFPFYFSGTLDGERDWGSAHNLYIHQLAERGALGLLALLLALGLIMRRLWLAEKRAATAWTLWGWSAWAAFLVLNMTETAFQTEQIATLALFAWACAEADLSRASKKL